MLAPFWLPETNHHRLIATIGLERHGNTALLRSAAVAPEYQGCGIGSRLTKALLEQAATNGVERVVLLTSTASEFFALYVAQNVPKSIAVVKLSSDFTQAELERVINHPTFAFPTSVARYRNRLLVVSSQFDTAGSPAAVSGTQPPVAPFWVTQIKGAK
jgi:GNAT superfamily N-acetyltransferase